MATADELGQWLDEWHPPTAEQLDNCRESMRLVAHAERLNKLLAAAIELEERRTKLEGRLREEMRSNDHPEEVHELIKAIYDQCKKIRPHTRTLVMAVSQAMEQRTEVTAAQRTNSELKGQREDIVAAVDVVEDEIQELLESIEELGESLKGRDGHPVIDQPVDVRSDAVHRQGPKTA